MLDRADEEATDGEHPSLGALFLAFLGMGVVGFGGILPWARVILVERRRWMSAAEFNDTLALCQFLPGPNIINMSIVFGRRTHGLAGALAASLGLIGAPMLIVLSLGALYLRYRHVEAVAGAVDGMAAAAAGLLVATVAKMAKPLFDMRAVAALGVAALAFAGVGVLELPLPAVLLALAPFSIALAWWKAL